MNSRGAASGMKAEAKRALRVGVIGAGVMGSNHARVLVGLPDIELVGVVDPLPAHRTRATELTGCRTSSPNRARLHRARYSYPRRKAGRILG